MNQPETVTMGLPCADVEAVLPLIADGQLDPDSDPAIFLHLADCTHCQHILARHDLITIALAECGSAAPAPVKSSSVRFIKPRWWGYAAAAAAVITLGAWTAWSGLGSAALVAPAPIIVDRVPSLDPDANTFRITTGEETITVDLNTIDGGNDRKTNRGGTSVMWRP